MDGLRGDVEVHHDARVHRDEVDLSHMLVQPNDGLVDQPALVGVHQLQGGFGTFGLLFVPGDQDALAQGGQHLHG